ncbi:hypothetical protein AC579_3139 [Pseudocercospora musae]|uniref:Uncharacterized protein n=1 Tax=Pseudocercospora musae TaxID=113226 RepID=A0A139I4I7_9PEZI|nr:hypothetical protein AC579_3139 [Pseudocercospora musae]
MPQDYHGMGTTTIILSKKGEKINKRKLNRAVTARSCWKSGSIAAIRLIMQGSSAPSSTEKCFKGAVRTIEAAIPCITPRTGNCALEV